MTEKERNFDKKNSDYAPLIQGVRGDFSDLYELLKNVTNTLISWAKPGMKVADLDTKAREMLGDYEKYFTHSLGHGVGIDIHEAPHISKRSDEILEP